MHNDNETKLEWLKVLLLAIKTSGMNDSNVFGNKQQKINSGTEKVGGNKNENS